MSDAVKRVYRSPLRVAQAEATRRRIVAAAAELFTASGYAATSVEAIAAAAEVSKKTVFTAVGGKAELLALAVDWAVAGDDAPVPLADRPEVIDLLAQPDAGTILDRWARVLTDVDSRVADLFVVLESAAGADDAARVLFERMAEQRRDGARAVVAAVGDTGRLRNDISRSEAIDLAALFTEPVLYSRLVGRRGWSRRKFEAWLGATLRDQLLTRSGSR